MGGQAWLQGPSQTLVPHVAEWTGDSEETSRVAEGGQLKGVMPHDVGTARFAITS